MLLTVRGFRYSCGFCINATVKHTRHGNGKIGLIERANVSGSADGNPVWHELYSCYEVIDVG
jgi:hypothetical protein